MGKGGVAMVTHTILGVWCSVFRMGMRSAQSSAVSMGRLKYVFLLGVLLNAELWMLRMAQAKCLGVHGIIYPVEELDPIALIRQKLKIMEASGELRQRNLELQKRTRAAVERPKPVKGITRAPKNRVFYYDPTYVVQTDLKDHQGRIFAKKGTKLNPLETVSLSTHLIFFDGDDEEQLAWVKGWLATPLMAPAPGQPIDSSANSLDAQNKLEKSVKVILINGTPLKLSEDLNIPVYFDQNGILTKKLGIRRVPALVTQDGQQLKIEEIKIPPSVSVQYSVPSAQYSEKLLQNKRPPTGSYVISCTKNSLNTEH
jgi:conjugal transfer pilus assembly protein TraW